MSLLASAFRHDGTPRRLGRAGYAGILTLTLVVLTFFGGRVRAQSFLLVPDSTNNTILALSAVDGSVINTSLISDPVRFGTPKNAIDSGRGTILVSDQIADAVFEYDFSGNFLGTIISGASSGIDNIRGIDVFGGDLYVTVGGGVYNNTVQRFQLDGTRVGTFASTNLSSPFDVFFRAGDVLVSNSTGSDIERFGLDGTYLGKFVDSNGVTNVDFPEQISARQNGNVLVAGFSAPAGIYEYTAAGALANYYNVGTGLRGVYELQNGLFLFTDGNSISTFNPTTGALADVITGGSFQYIELAAGANVIPEPGTIVLLGVGLLGTTIVRRRRH